MQRIRSWQTVIGGGGALVVAALLSACSGPMAVTRLGPVAITVGQTTIPTTTSSAKSLPRTVAAAPSAAVSSTAVQDLQNAFVAAVQKAGPSVVQIETPAGLGSGIVLDSQGHIVTNAHVVESFQTFVVTTSTGTQMTGHLVGSDPTQDLAVISVAGGSLTPAEFADSSQLQVGDVVMAIGSPYGLQGSLTQGLVSALGRSVAESYRITLNGLIQTSAPINPGNSGGALTNLAGQVVGIPTLGATSADGIGFAIPSDQVIADADRLIQAGSRAAQ